MLSGQQMTETILSICDSVFNQGDSKQVSKLVCDKFLYTTPTSKVSGIDAFLDYINLIHREWRDLCTRIYDLHSEGDHITGRFESRATSLDSSRLGVRSDQPIVLGGTLKAVFNMETGRMCVLEADYLYSDIIRQSTLSTA